MYRNGDIKQVQNRRLVNIRR